MNGFADLRLNLGSPQSDDSFWPSFTDIMAVVVMIFLITTSVLILRNWELIQQITRTSEAEQRAMALARETSEAKATVEEQLADAKYRISILRLELLRSEQERQRRQAELTAERERSAQLATRLGTLEARLTDEERNRAALETELQELSAAQTVLRVQLAQEASSKEALSEGLQELATQFTDLQARHETTSGELTESRAALASERRRYAELQTQAESVSTELSATRELAQSTAGELSALRAQAQTTSSELSALQTQYDQRGLRIRELQESATLVEARYASLVGEYDDLKVKYDKLIKPARSARGKYVVEVRYFRTAGEYQLSMREPDNEAFRNLGLAELHQTLSALRDRFPERLYIRIIFPEESGLTYAEAWGFTQDLLARYDYYYRER